MYINNFEKCAASYKVIMHFFIGRLRLQNAFLFRGSFYGPNYIRPYFYYKHSIRILDFRIQNISIGTRIRVLNSYLWRFRLGDLPILPVLHDSHIRLDAHGTINDETRSHAPAERSDN